MISTRLRLHLYVYMDFSLYLHLPEQTILYAAEKYALILDFHNGRNAPGFLHFLGYITHTFLAEVEKEGEPSEKAYLVQRLLQVGQSIWNV